MKIDNFLTYLALNTDYDLTPRFEEFFLFEREGAKFLIDIQPNLEEADSIRICAEVENKQFHYAYYDFGDPDGLYGFGESQKMMKSLKGFNEIFEHCQAWLKELK